MQGNRHYGRPKNFKLETNKFVIKHYAGDVEYSVSNFIETNRDTVNLQISDILKLSTNPLVKELVTKNFEEKNEQKCETPKALKDKNMMSKFNLKQPRNSDNGSSSK